MNVKIEIKNQQPFTAPGESINMDIAPVTIITGENGVGKSILLKSIANNNGTYNDVVIDSSLNFAWWESTEEYYFEEYYFQHQDDMLRMPLPIYDKLWGGWIFNYQKLCTPRKFSDIVRVWFDYFGLGEISIEEPPVEEQLIFNKYTKPFRHILKLNNVDIHNMGAGKVCITNLILRILHTIALSQTDLQNIFLYVLHPEIYLSRGNQKKVADFLCAVSTLGAHVIVETHSDAICNEVCKIAMQSYSQDKMNDFKVYNLVKQNNITFIQNIEIDKYKGFVNKHESEFLDIASEYKAIMEAAHSNLKLDGKLE